MYLYGFKVCIICKIFNFINIFNYNIFIHFIDNNSDTWTIEYIEVNDIGNDLKIKYLPDKYWYNLEQSNNILLVANKSMKQIKNYKILVDLFKTNDFKPINKYGSRMNIFNNSINRYN